ncbi:hypothetical protein KIPB_004594 [Kipferlia bialata]|uniref:NTF2 domain-containing protein n=1 Tax=Kipferlia bialata TaxID=797122 RepID=A0A9K3GHK1_9EUKA|nr:hypothetical protein KIPB_004594 [Kipferlia bialata]|eukprot:g4594.t1
MNGRSLGCKFASEYYTTLLTDPEHCIIFYHDKVATTVTHSSQTAGEVIKQYNTAEEVAEFIKTEFTSYGDHVKLKSIDCSAYEGGLLIMCSGSIFAHHVETKTFWESFHLDNIVTVGPKGQPLTAYIVRSSILRLEEVPGAPVTTPAVVAEAVEEVVEEKEEEEEEPVAEAPKAEAEVEAKAETPAPEAEAENEAPKEAEPEPVATEAVAEAVAEVEPKEAKETKEAKEAKEAKEEAPKAKAEPRERRPRREREAKGKAEPRREKEAKPRADRSKATPKPRATGKGERERRNPEERKRPARGKTRCFIELTGDLGMDDMQAIVSRYGQVERVMPAREVNSFTRGMQQHDDTTHTVMVEYAAEVWAAIPKEPIQCKGVSVRFVRAKGRSGPAGAASRSRGVHGAEREQNTARNQRWKRERAEKERQRQKPSE